MGQPPKYRNKSNFLFAQFCKKYGFSNVFWNFSKAGHGKGAADGIVGVLKRSCNAKVAGGIDITDVASFVKAVSEIKVKLFRIEEEDIVKIKMTLPETLKPVPGNMKLHQIIWTHLNEESICLRELSCDTLFLRRFSLN
ncbi:unnamed protein product [Psylliodes chrysocephalus]|uniref:Uncharacterized protein n=1 Tax=Psylliodes chrysocephalus TaxID=3402493 RepID=A0A9P0DA42_9CUCU|nr:unnamed protein product [Psylliodes chrysocephala]